MFELHAEDLSRLGGPMGTETVRTIYRKFFSKITFAKYYAEREYALRGHRTTEIKWSASHQGRVWTSGDLGFVKYTIRPVEVER